MPEIGATLREARMRARIDVSEIEAQTKIRAKYLRALENEEWGLLPGPTFVKSFLRTYAQALGLDGKALVEEYRVHHEGQGDVMLEPLAASSQRSRGRNQALGPSRGYVAAVSAIGLIILVLVVLLLVGGGSSGKRTTARKRAAATAIRPGHKGAAASGGTRAAADVVTLSLKPTGSIYVCLIGESGRRLIAGEELQAGQNTPTYRARHFELVLGNNAVTLYIDGRARTVPASTEAIGYSITKLRGRRTLAASQLPTCK
ncbi:MAG: helix-turn-helix domain-containing protein [Solirubrobacteraceae bacterium]